MVQVTPSTESPIREAAEIEPMGLVTTGARSVACVEGSLGRRVLVAVRAPQSDLRDALGMWLVTSDAVFGVLRCVRRLDVLVAPLAHAVARRANVMRRMAAVAISVVARHVLREHSRLFVARSTPQRRRCGK